MWRLTLRNLIARKVRLLMSALAIVLGVAFLSGVLVFSHGLSSTFDTIVKGTTSDGQVRPKGTEAFSGTNDSSAVLSGAVVRRLAALPEVARADGSVDGYGMNLLDSDGALVGGSGAPTLAFNHTGAPDMTGQPKLLLDQGTWPSGPDQVALDDSAASRGGYKLGDTVNLLAPFGTPERTAKLVGIVEFNGGGTAGATLIVFDTPTAQQIFLGGLPVFTSVDLTAKPGVSQKALAAAAQTVLPAGYEAVTGDKIVDESQSSINQLLNVISTFLLVFALIAVLVGGFIIVNTFSILVAQRTRELALLRALGATRRQVTRSVLVEAVVMALIASTVGIGLGWLLARGLAALFRAAGLDISGGVLGLTGTTIAIAYGVGLIVTVVAAWLPARRAGRVAPVAAMRGDSPTPPASLRRRTIIGTAIVLLGVALAAFGLADTPGPAAAWVGAAAVLWVLTAAVLSSVAGRPVLIACRALFGRLFGTAGRLAGENALRDPRRTGATASALMIGLALVCTIGVLAASLNKTVDDIVDDQFSADYLVQSTNFLPFSTQIGDQMADVPGVQLVSRQQLTSAKLPDGDRVQVTGNDAAFATIYTFDMDSGRQDIKGDEALINSDVAKAHHWKVGQTITLTFQAGHVLKVKIVGISEVTPTTAGISIPLPLLATADVARRDTSVSILVSPGADTAAVHQALSAVAKDSKVVALYDKEGFADAIRAQVNQLLYLIYGLLALAIIIAVIGIVNTLGLSVLERTREIGLLRAIGMNRRRLRLMVTLESVAIALLGAVLGMVVGLASGILLRQALKDDITSLGLPWGQVIAFLVVAVVVGVLAAVLPAIRAARMAVLTAIAAP